MVTESELSLQQWPTMRRMTGMRLKAVLRQVFSTGLHSFLISWFHKNSFQDYGQNVISGSCCFASHLLYSTNNQAAIDCYGHKTVINNPP